MNYTKENPLKVFTAFSGYDSQCLALNELRQLIPGFDYTLVGWSEIDKYAIQAHNALFPEAADLNYGDISKIDWSQVPDFDLFTYSFPCGLKGTLVKTDKGYKDISDIKQGDMVLTHNNRYRSVVKTMTRTAPGHYKINATGTRLTLTAEHPLWVLRDGIQKWVKVKDLLVTDKLSYCIPLGNLNTNIDDNTLWMLGRYVADGWINPHLYHSVEFAVAFQKAEEFEAHTPKGFKFCKAKKSCWEYRVAHEEFQELCKEFGSGAKNKLIPEWLEDMAPERISIFLDGYFSGDGHIRNRGTNKVQMFSTVSKKLFLGLQRLIMKVHGRVCSLSVRHDNRKDTFNDTYNGQFSFGKPVTQEKRGDRIFVKINKIEYIEGDVPVYNFEVADDNSYTCDNVNTHNCTDISTAGLQKGLSRDSGTRSGLLWECEKTIKYKRPKFLLMENVKALVSKKFLPDFNAWLELLNNYGYDTFYQVCNAKDYGVPQNRERVFAISYRQDLCLPRYIFPEPIPLDKCIEDVLEDEVDEKYFLADERVEGLIESTLKEQKAGRGYKFEPKTKEDIAGHVSTKGGGRKTDTFVKVEQ